MRVVAVLAAILVATSVGCAGDERADSQCVAAFREAEPRAEPPYQVSPLDDAVKRCQTVEEWQDAWDRVPEAHPAGQDAIPYLQQRCAVTELQQTDLCRDLGEGAAARALHQTGETAPGSPTGTGTRAP